MTNWGGSHSWLFTLGILKAAGALGLLVGIGIPLIGLAAAVGLVLFFIGAIIVALRARWYSHVPWSATYLVLAMASLALRLTQRERKVDRFLLKTMPDATAVRRKMLFVKLGTRKREIRLDENGALAANALRTTRSTLSSMYGRRITACRA